MCRLLHQNELIHNLSQTFVQLSEVRDEGHWFDGVVDDDALQPFLDEHLKQVDNARLPQSFSVVTMNPDTSGSKGGLRITQMLLPTQLGRLQVERTSNSVWRIRTQNVARIEYGVVHRLKDRASALIIDGSRFEVDLTRLSTSDRVERFCRDGALVNEPVWKVCDLAGHDGNRRAIGEHGPLSAVLRKGETMIVYPDGDDEILSKAVDYANVLYLHGVNTHVVSDTQAVKAGMDSSKMGIIFLGDVNTNHATRHYMREGAVRMDSENRVCVSLSAGDKCFGESGTGAAWIGKGVQNGVVAVVVGVDREGFLAGMDLLPESPDSSGAEWAIVDARLWRVKGVGAIRAAGYFDERWRILPTASYFDDGDAGGMAERCDSGNAWTWRELVVALALVAVGGALGVWFGGRREAAYEIVAGGQERRRLGGKATKSDGDGGADSMLRLLDEEQDDVEVGG